MSEIILTTLTINYSISSFSLRTYTYPLGHEHFLTRKVIINKPELGILNNIFNNIYEEIKHDICYFVNLYRLAKDP